MNAAAAFLGLLFAGGFVLVSADQNTIVAKPGQNVTLTCRATNRKITVLKWNRPDLEPEYVLLYQDGWFDLDDQHPSFKNRVDLQDRDMKDGNVSLILKNVTTADDGTYVCSVFMEGASSWQTISIIYLRVAPPGQTGLTIGLTVMSAVVLPILSLLIYKRYRYLKQHQSQDPGHPPAEKHRTEVSQSLLKLNSEFPAVPNSQGLQETESTQSQMTHRDTAEHPAHGCKPQTSRV